MISTIQKVIKDPQFTIFLQEEWGSKNLQSRLSIRQHLAKHHTRFFTRAQLANLSDLNLVPESEVGCFSISHTQSLGGFTYSEYLHGFDLEEAQRVSEPVIRRTSTAEEFAEAPNKKLLWSAKEAAYKAVARPIQPIEKFNLIMTDFICTNWQSPYNTDVWTFKIQSSKKLNLVLNQGFAFEEKDMIFAIFFR